MIHVAVADLDAFDQAAYVPALAREGTLGRQRLKRILRAKRITTQRERVAASLLLMEMKALYNLKAPFLYSLSHSGDKVLCAVEDDRWGARYLGCDIEKIRSVRENVTKHAFSEEERAFLQVAKDRNKTFTKIWTLKESCVKALRTGLAVPLQKVAFDLSGEDIVCHYVSQNLTFKTAECDDAYCIAICSDGRIDEEIIYRKWEDGGIYG